MSEPPGVSPRLIVGLGNPGGRYEDTRHNVGFAVVDRVAKARGLEWVREKKWEVKVAREQEQGAAVTRWFAKPQTFMNLSGRAVSGMARFFRIATEEILVVYDDVNLPLGTLRFRASGSAGGHNGVQSVIECLGGDGFPRLKLGIAGGRGRPSGAAMSSHVLGRFATEEREAVAAMVSEGAAAVECAIVEGLGVAMNRYNQKPKKVAGGAGEVSGGGVIPQKIGEENLGEKSPPLQSGAEGAIDHNPNTE